MLLGVEGNTLNGRKDLSLNWDITSDAFILHFDRLVMFAKDLPLNRRSVLRVVAKLYDPFGFISLLLTSIKFLFQDLCEMKIN